MHCFDCREVSGLQLAVFFQHENRPLHSCISLEYVPRIGCKDANRLVGTLAKLFKYGGDLMTVRHAPQSGGSADKVCLTNKEHWAYSTGYELSLGVSGAKHRGWKGDEWASLRFQLTPDRAASLDEGALCHSSNARKQDSMQHVRPFAR